MLPCIKERKQNLTKLCSAEPSLTSTHPAHLSSLLFSSLKSVKGTNGARNEVLQLIVDKVEIAIKCRVDE